MRISAFTIDEAGYPCRHRDLEVEAAEARDGDTVTLRISRASVEELQRLARTCSLWQLEGRPGMWFFLSKSWWDWMGRAGVTFTRQRGPD